MFSPTERGYDRYDALPALDHMAFCEKVRAYDAVCKGALPSSCIRY
jgi:hypothetical protein